MFMKYDVNTDLSNTSPIYHPLTSGQRDVWLDQMVYPDVPFYNIGGYLRIDGHIDPVVFEQALRRVVQSNDALRIVLHKGNPLPVQEFRNDGVFDIPFIDFSEQKDPMQKAEAWMQAQFVRPFELYGHFLFRYAIIKISDQCYCYFNNQHHLVADGLSILILTEQLSKEYNALMMDQLSNEFPPSYHAFILEEQKFFQSKRCEQSKAFWQKIYKDLPEPLVSYPKRDTENDVPFRGGLSALRIKPSEYAVLEDFCKAQGVTPYHLLLAALYVCFLHNGIQKDFVYGAPVLNRSHAKAKKTIGLFTSVSPVRFCFGLDINTLDLLGLISEELKRVYRYQRLPLGEINKLCGISQAFGRSLFDIGVSYEKNDYGMTFQGARAQAITYSNGFERQALSIALKEYRKGDDIELDFSYNLQVFDAKEIDYLKHRVLFVMEEMVRNPHTNLNRLDILPASEKTDVLRGWNETQKEIPKKLAHHFFEDCAKAMPEQWAAVCGQQQMTYRVLNEQANQLAHYLTACGIGKQDFVGICIDRSFHMLVAILGVLKAGAAYIPLDPNYPKARLAFMIGDAKVKLILTQEDLLSVLPQDGGDVFCLDRDRAHWQGQSAKPIVLQTADTDDLAYVIYTSGSTGQPKGVMIGHQSLVNLIVAQTRLFDIQAQSRLLQFASFSFDASVSEIFTTLSSGATLVLASKDEIMPGPNLVQTLKAFEVTHVTLPPSSLGVLPDADLPALETLVVAGEACAEDLAKKWSPGRRFMNAYGPTEATVCASTWVFEKEMGKPLIGRPIDNVQLYVLNDDLRPVSVGQAGELHIAGMGVAKGYLNRPELECEKFIPNPFDKRDGSRLYKTGDLVRWLADGNLDFLGRKDFQVKIRGFRVELEEIESTLRQHASVQDAIVIVTEWGPQVQNLVAYFIPSGKVLQDDTSVLKSFLQSKLPNYMVPHFVLPIDQFPLTPSGKIDRNGFPKPTGAFSKDAENSQPVTDAEQKLLSIWNGVMPGVQIGIQVPFFDVGLDSLKTIQFIYQVEAEFDVKLHPSVLFQQNTVSALGQFLSEKKDGFKPSQSLVHIQIKEKKVPFFCVTGGYGDVLVFKDLAQFMPRSFYALQPPSWTNDNALSFADLARYYVRDIQSVQKKGPYLLGGYSLGGIIALEMAREFKEMGEQVDALVVFGAPLTHGVLGHWVYKRLMGTVKKFVPESEQSESEVVRILKGLFRDEGLQRHMNSLTGYVASPYSGKITIFEGKQASSRFYPWKKKWQQLAYGGLEIVMLPGNHHSFIRSPNNAAFAQHLECCLEGVMANSVGEVGR